MSIYNSIRDLSSIYTQLHSLSPLQTFLLKTWRRLTRFQLLEDLSATLLTNNYLLPDQALKAIASHTIWFPEGVKRERIGLQNPVLWSMQRRLCA